MSYFTADQHCCQEDGSRLSPFSHLLEAQCAFRCSTVRRASTHAVAANGSRHFTHSSNTYGNFYWDFLMCLLTGQPGSCAQACGSGTQAPPQMAHTCTCYRSTVLADGNVPGPLSWRAQHLPSELRCGALYAACLAEGYQILRLQHGKNEGRASCAGGVASLQQAANMYHTSTSLQLSIT